MVQISLKDPKTDTAVRKEAKIEELIGFLGATLTAMANSVKSKFSQVVQIFDFKANIRCECSYQRASQMIYWFVRGRESTVQIIRCESLA